MMADLSRYGKVRHTLRCFPAQRHCTRCRELGLCRGLPTETWQVFGPARRSRTLTYALSSTILPGNDKTGMLLFRGCTLRAPRLLTQKTSRGRLPTPALLSYTVKLFQLFPAHTLAAGTVKGSPDPWVHLPCTRIVHLAVIFGSLIHQQ